MNKTSSSPKTKKTTLAYLLSISALAFSIAAYVKPGFTKVERLEKEALIDYRKSPVNLSFQLADNRILNLTKFRGKIVFINFWAPWCSSCRKEMSSLNSFYQKVATDGDVVFLTVDLDKDSTSARRYMNRMSFNFPVVREIAKTPKSIFPGELPTTIILDREGKISYRYTGEINFNEREFQSAIEKVRSAAKTPSLAENNESVPPERPIE